MFVQEVCRAIGVQHWRHGIALHDRAAELRQKAMFVTRTDAIGNGGQVVPVGKRQQGQDHLAPAGIEMAVPQRPLRNAQTGRADLLILQQVQPFRVKAAEFHGAAMAPQQSQAGQAAAPVTVVGGGEDQTMGLDLLPVDFPDQGSAIASLRATSAGS